MNRYVLLVLAALSWSVASAQSFNVVREAQIVANEIEDSQYRLTESQRRQIAQRLLQIRQILVGEQPGNPQIPEANQYTCVARDNDNRAPFVFALRNGINMVRVSGSNFDSLDACRTSLERIRKVANRSFLCVSRDNDSRSPFTMAVLDGSNLRKVDYSNTDSLSNCYEALNSLVVTSKSVLYCASRDNDSRSPFTAYALDLNSLQVTRGSELFQTISECRRSVL